MKHKLILLAAILTPLAIACIAVRSCTDHSGARGSQTTERHDNAPLLGREGSIGAYSSKHPDTSQMSGLPTHVPRTNTTLSSANETGTALWQSVQEQRSGESSEVTTRMIRASGEFKSERVDRRKAAKELIPFLKRGMSDREVEELLGHPNYKVENGRTWAYVMFYDSMLAVHFDENGRLTSVVGAK